MYKLTWHMLWYRDEQISVNNFSIISRACCKMLNQVIKSAVPGGVYNHMEITEEGRILLYWDRQDGLWYSSTLIDDLAGHSALQGQIKSIGRMILGRVTISERT